MPTTFVPHYRLSLIGTLPNAEQFTCNLALAWQDEWNDPGWDLLLGDDAFDANWDHIVGATEQFWMRASSGIALEGVLRRIKMAPIGANGRYTAAPREAAVNIPGGSGEGEDEQHMLPHQISRKVTLETDGDLGRIKGGFYLPAVADAGWDRTTNLISVAKTEAVRASVTAYLDAIENAPGLDLHGSFYVNIASQGRHNLDGSVRLGPGLHKVKRVNVGRRLDVQRRRANKISEARLADAVLADQGN